MRKVPELAYNPFSNRIARVFDENGSGEVRGHAGARGSVGAAGSSFARRAAAGVVPGVPGLLLELLAARPHQRKGAAPGLQRRRKECGAPCAERCMPASSVERSRKVHVFFGGALTNMWRGQARVAFCMYDFDEDGKLGLEDLTETLRLML